MIECRPHYTAGIGFTLIELSIVLVIIGLIIGSVLIGRDLIKAAELRATIQQIEQYRTAVSAFKLKYSYLPGDIPDPTASSFGFKARTSGAATGDGNGTIQGTCNGNNTCYCGFCLATGEQPMTWVDLSYANLIPGKFDTANTTGTVSLTSGDNLKNYYPTAKIGRGNFIYVWSGGSDGGWLYPGDGNNYFGLSAVSDISGWTLNSTPALTIAEASAIDQKIDDGIPQAGRVMAWYYNWALVNYHPTWAAGNGAQGVSTSYGPATTATAASSDTCYDNRGVAGQQKYSIITSTNANSLNCALSFRF